MGFNVFASDRGVPLGAWSVVIAMAGCGDAPRTANTSGAATDGVSATSGVASSGTAPTAATSRATGGSETGTECEPFCDEDAADGGVDVPLGECGGVTLALDPLPTSAVLVLDRSSSMSTNWDGPAGRESRWESLHTVVSDVVGTFDAVTHFGAVLFPEVDGLGGCSVATEPEVPVGPGNGAAILAAMPGAEDPDATDGSTPVLRALQTARSHLESLDPSVPRAIILVTDGVPACGTTNDVLEAFVGDTFQAAGIPTYVVGIAVVGFMHEGELVEDQFARVARAGGVPSEGTRDFYDANNQEELESALATISHSIRSCTMDLDPAPDDPTRTRVLLDDAIIPKIQDCSAEDGWTFVDESSKQAIVCGSWCETLKSSSAQQLEAKYGCPPPG